ncbi:MAG: phosphatidylserine/phosphatidylglycerophosphate/cardiolipin synthase family protein [Deltaproteobacteria bacterium]
MHPAANHIPHARNASYPLREGNLLIPLIDGPAAFGRIAEAVEAAEHSVWVTLAFHEREFRFPGGRGSLIDLLDTAAKRGVDVRGLFWREPNLEDLVADSEIFSGTREEHEALHARDFRGQIRWDHLPDFCHHQKSWVIDAGRSSETAFVGGINLDRGSLSAPGHAIRGADETDISGRYAEIHDLYSELRGPAVTDVVHNFTQRWNEASERSKDDGAFPDADAVDDLPRPSETSGAAGDMAVQITRTIMPGILADTTPSPGAASFAIAEGESSVREQVLAAVASARRTIHIENQIFLSKALLGGLRDALARGVRVIALVPRIPMQELIDYRRRAPESVAPIFDLLEECGHSELFTFAALAKKNAQGRLVDIYIHAKIMLVDDVWGTIGSTNFMSRSFFQETELNASFWCPETVRRLREDLFNEHLEGAAAGLDEVAAFDRFHELAAANQPRFAAGDNLQGLAHALAPEDYCK